MVPRNRYLRADILLIWSVHVPGMIYLQYVRKFAATCCQVEEKPYDLIVSAWPAVSVSWVRDLCYHRSCTTTRNGRPGSILSICSICILYIYIYDICDRPVDDLYLVWSVCRWSIYLFIEDLNYLSVDDLSICRWSICPTCARFSSQPAPLPAKKNDYWNKKHTKNDTRYHTSKYMVSSGVS